MKKARDVLSGKKWLDRIPRLNRPAAEARIQRGRQDLGDVGLCGLCALCERKVFEGTVDPASAAEVRMKISACSFLPVFWRSA